MDETINLLQETTQAISKTGHSLEDIKYIFIKKDDDTVSDVLIKDYSSSSVSEEELKNLDFDYDYDYGKHYVYGFVAFRDGSYLQRADYDGYEWWKYHRCPKFEDLLKVDNDNLDRLI